MIGAQKRQPRVEFDVFPMPRLLSPPMDDEIVDALSRLLLLSGSSTKGMFAFNTPFAFH